ncbi:unnamed protein product [Owenia fusiformis]|uniref:Sodium-dependent glucose transporter 1 n=1 Tax=Owenia fusiformis TaxID=6347 RepID=A0A8S4P000_OWEFU|nr:unnamed protein product [Owenia fusiformis]
MALVNSTTSLHTLGLNQAAEKCPKGKQITTHGENRNASLGPYEDAAKSNVHSDGLKTKIVKTASLYIAFIGLGITLSVLGPTVLDLRDKTGVTTSEISIVFTGRSLGFLMGSIIGGALIDRFNQTLVIAFSLLLGAVAVTITPWFTQLALVVTALGFLGISSGILDTCGQVFLLLVWESKIGPYFQLSHFFFGIGSFIGPLLAKPFISSYRSNASTNITNGNYHNNQAYQSMYNNSYHGNYISNSFGYHGNNNTIESEALQRSDESRKYINITSTTGYNITEKMDEIKPLELMTESNVEYVYLIIGILHLFMAVVFFGITLQGKRTLKALEYKTDSSHGNKETKSRLYSLQILCLLFSFLYCYGGIEYIIGGLLMTFLNVALGWSKETGTVITSAFWGAFMLARLIAVPLTKMISFTKLLLIDTFLLAASIVGLLIFVQHPIAVWVCIITAGLSMGTVFASILSWIQNNAMQVTGVVAGTALAAASISGMTLPPLVSYLFPSTYMVFVYTILVLSFLLIIIFAILYITVFIHRKNERKIYNRNIYTSVSMTDKSLPA